MRRRTGREYNTKNPPPDSGSRSRIPRLMSTHNSDPNSVWCGLPRATVDTIQGASSRNSAARACAVKPSARAKVEAKGASMRAPCGEHPMIDVRFWKSYTPKGDEKRAVPAVGSTWLGPAQ